MKVQFVLKRQIEAFFFENLEKFVSEIEIVDHPVVVWAEADQIFWRIVGFVLVDVVNVHDFVETADYTLFCDFSVGFKVDIVGFSLIIGFALVEMENVVVTAWTEAFGVDLHFPFTSFAGCQLRLPV